MSSKRIPFSWVVLLVLTRICVNGLLSMVGSIISAAIVREMKDPVCRAEEGKRDSPCSSRWFVRVRATLSGVVSTSIDGRTSRRSADVREWTRPNFDRGFARNVSRERESTRHSFVWEWSSREEWMCSKESSLAKIDRRAVRVWRGEDSPWFHWRCDVEQDCQSMGSPSINVQSDRRCSRVVLRCSTSLWDPRWSGIDRLIGGERFDWRQILRQRWSVGNRHCFLRWRRDHPTIWHQQKDFERASFS